MKLFKSTVFVVSMGAMFIGNNVFCAAGGTACAHATQDEEKRASKDGGLEPIDAYTKAYAQLAKAGLHNKIEIDLARAIDQSVALKNQDRRFIYKIAEATRMFARRLEEITHLGLAKAITKYKKSNAPLDKDFIEHYLQFMRITRCKINEIVLVLVEALDNPVIQALIDAYPLKEKDDAEYKEAVVPTSEPMAAAASSSSTSAIGSSIDSVSAAAAASVAPAPAPAPAPIPAKDSQEPRESSRPGEKDSEEQRNNQKCTVS